MKLSEQLERLKEEYIKKMPEKRLMLSSIVIDRLDEKQETEYWALPEMYYGSDASSAIIAKMIYYQDGVMNCYDGESDVWLEFNILSNKTDRLYFPLETLAEFNEY